ncbi:MAG TPA: acyl-CoA dehydrogenase family protein [Burkholderiaceae bacterium]|nr:acyl-CoA dehydrogenase family protein [Burkholderiaceae bacterium]
MRFSTDPAIEAFRAQVREFLSKNLPPALAARNATAVHPTKADMQAWTRILHQRGWSAPHWPVEYGGTGWSALQRHIFEEECFVAGAPPTCTSAFRLVAPVIYTFGNEAQKRRYLPPILCGDAFWGQGFSEPGAGSDLASLRTIARRVADAGDDYYIVSGQKTWTSEAHQADMLFCLVRTQTTAKPQQGISFLLIDAKAPGVTIRPIISIDGGHSLNEMFFDDVRVPAENLVGEEGKGWSYARFLLEHERAFSAEVPRNKRMFACLLDLAGRERRQGKRLIEDAAFAARVARVEVELAALEFLTMRALSEADTGTSSWPAGSVLHILGSELQQKIGDLLVEALGDYGALALLSEAENGAQDGAHEAACSVDRNGDRGTDSAGDRLRGEAIGPSGRLARASLLVADYLYRRAVTIYGGSNEIQRNLIARNYLRL